MTIGEVERRTDLDRANIRFYEREGLLTAARRENGYRDYTEEDVQTLLRIRLLRSLRVPLEDIRAMQRGEQTLSVTLTNQIDLLAREQATAQRAGQVCRAIRDADLSFDTLDAESWLPRLSSGISTPKPAPLPPEDREQQPYCPGRRFAARWLDLTLYKSILMALYGLLGGNLMRLSTVASGLIGLLAMVVMLFVEPLLLQLFSTTPGKALMGLRVERREMYDGTYPGYGEGVQRTWLVLWRGYGFGIPIFSLVRLWKSWSADSEDKELDWEDGYLQVLRDTHWWRWVASTTAAVLFIGAPVLLGLNQQRPPHRGDLTPAQLVQNFHYYQERYDVTFGRTLQLDGTWQEAPTPGTAVIHLGQPPAPLQFETEDGFVTAVSFTAHPDSESGIFFVPENQMFLLALSLAGAQEEATLFSDFHKHLAEGLEKYDFQADVITLPDFEGFGVRILRIVDQTGYRPGTSVWMANEDAEDASLTFTCRIECTD